MTRRLLVASDVNVLVSSWPFPLSDEGAVLLEVSAFFAVETASRIVEIIRLHNNAVTCNWPVIGKTGKVVDVYGVYPVSDTVESEVSESGVALFIARDLHSRVLGRKSLEDDALISLVVQGLP